MIVHEFHRVRNRPLSASRKRRQNSSRRSSFNSDPILSERMTFNPESILPGNNVFYSTLDLYSTKDKLESLENEMKLLEDDSTVYTSHLFMLYFNLLPQAKTHILNARQILEQLNIKPIDDHLNQNLFAFEDTLNILCDSLSDKKRLCDDFSEEVIQSKPCIGAIYLYECEYLNAAEHLKECLDLQEFVNGPKDS
ncbi:unnamed protein product [Adineta steineri]|uniref:Uncharacterized protein n=1 Tax=Adineta steineri TaxID=433720 RepID=A0A815KQ10_9BILA|nr:unnamed protein product [Adineta steineri]